MHHHSIGIALILAAVFVPVGFIPGIVGRLYQRSSAAVGMDALEQSGWEATARVGPDQ